MAVYSYNPVMELFRGHINKQIVIRHCHKLVISRYPDMEGIIRSTAQRQCNSRFARAVWFASRVKELPELWPFIRSVEKQITDLYKAAISVYMHYEDLFLSWKGTGIAPEALQIEGSCSERAGLVPRQSRKRRFSRRILHGDFSKLPKHLRPPEEFAALFSQDGI